MHFSLLPAAFSVSREGHQAFISSTRWKQLGLTAKCKAGQKRKFTMSRARENRRQRGARGESTCANTTVSPEAEERKICPQNSHREGSSDESRNFRSHTNPEYPLKVAEELPLCVTNLIREKAPLQCRDCKGKPQHAAHSRSPAQCACSSERSRGFHRHPGEVPAPFFTHPPGSLLAGALSAWLVCDTASGMSPRPADQDTNTRMTHIAWR